MKLCMTLFAVVFLVGSVISPVSASPTVHGDYYGWAATAFDAGNNDGQ